MGEIIFILTAGFLLAAVCGFAITKAAKKLEWVSEWEEEDMEERIMCSVELDRETYDWVWKKSAERGCGTRDFIRGLVEEARRRDGRGLRERESEC